MRWEPVRAIRNCVLVDPATGRTRAGVDVHWEDGVIDAVSSQRHLRGDESHLDGTGLFAVPGLIDMHVHMASDPFGAVLGSKGTFGQSTMVLLAAHNLRIALEAGITTVRDLGTPGQIAVEVRRAWDKGLVHGARPVVSGPVITAAGGHGAKMGLQAIGPDMVREHVRRNVSAGVDLIKFAMASAARSVELSHDELSAGIEEAHAHGRRVAVHANFSAHSIATALRAGCDTLEHGYALTAASIEQMVATGTALCPTISALRAVAEHAGLFAERAGPDLARAAVTHLPIARAAFLDALTAGVRIIAGTDAGVPFTGFDALHRELSYLVDWGMSHAGAVRAATSDAADVMGRSDLGRLAPGASADILLVAGNPLDDVAVLAEPPIVLLRGALAVNHSPQRIIRPTAVSGGGTGGAR